MLSKACTVIPHASNCVLDLHIPNHFAAQSFNLLQKLSLSWDGLLEGCLQIWLGRGGIASIGRHNGRTDSYWLW